MLKTLKHWPWHVLFAPKERALTHTRFAVYYVPTETPLARFGAAWLGWDVVSGRIASQPNIPGISDITATPRKYGFHATLKPPVSVGEVV